MSFDLLYDMNSVMRRFELQPCYSSSMKVIFCQTALFISMF